jgi:hypothetical protein
MNDDPVRITGATMVFYLADGSTQTIEVPMGNDVRVEIADTVDEPTEDVLGPCRYGGGRPYIHLKTRGVTITVQVKPGGESGELIRVT